MAWIIADPVLIIMRSEPLKTTKSRNLGIKSSQWINQPHHPDLNGLFNLCCSHSTLHVKLRLEKDHKVFQTCLLQRVNVGPLVANRREEDWHICQAEVCGVDHFDRLARASTRPAILSPSKTCSNAHCHLELVLVEKYLGELSSIGLENSWEN